MSKNFSITVQTKKDAIYLNLSGDFDGSSAWELLHFIKRNCCCAPTVFIDTNRLNHIYPFGQQVFENNFSWLNPYTSDLVFSGKKRIYHAS